MTDHSRRLAEVPGDSITLIDDDQLGVEVHEWYCRHCEEWLGWPEIDEHDAEICDDPAECPHSVDWEGDACGHVICKWCHEPAVDRPWTAATGDDETIVVSIDRA